MTKNLPVFPADFTVPNSKLFAGVAHNLENKDRVVGQKFRLRKKANSILLFIL